MTTKLQSVHSHVRFDVNWGDWPAGHAGGGSAQTSVGAGTVGVAGGTDTAGAPTSGADATDVAGGDESLAVAALVTGTLAAIPTVAGGEGVDVSRAAPVAALAGNDAPGLAMVGGSSTATWSAAHGALPQLTSMAAGGASVAPLAPPVELPSGAGAVVAGSLAATGALGAGDDADTDADPGADAPMATPAATPPDGASLLITPAAASAGVATPLAPGTGANRLR